jgi:hypothetical protein
MEYKRAYWDEPVDEHMVREHERRIFPLMRRRWLFSGAHSFVFYDFWVNGSVNEDVFAYSNRCGEHRALIVYHNRFASTAGWVRSSTSYAVRSGNAEEMTLKQTTLGDSLGFKGDGRHYYIFKDYSSGLEYIRNGRELCNDGLFVEMEAYEYHAYLDFREVWDDEYGTWGRLCHQLQGRPVESMDEEVKLIRFAPLIESLEEIIDRHAGLLTGAFGELDIKRLTKNRDKFLVDLGTFLSGLADLAEVAGDPLKIVSTVGKELVFLEGEYAHGATAGICMALPASRRRTGRCR